MTVITTATGLQNMKNDLTASYELGNNIDCSGIANFEPVGGWGGAADFTGSFDGKGYTISNLTINRPTDDYIGLFGETDRATIKNVTLQDFSITGYDRVGSLIGSVEDDAVIRTTLIDNINVVGCNVTGNYTIGGMIGRTQPSPVLVIRNSKSSGAVTGVQTVVGLIGSISGASGELVEDCSSSCTVISTNDGGATGGFAGTCLPKYYRRCYATGNVTATRAAGQVRAGGFAGITHGNTDSCYATGNVIVTGGSDHATRAGGFSGQSQSVITNCYATGTAKAVNAGFPAQEYAGGFVGWQRMS